MVICHHLCSPSRKTKRKEAENSYCVTLDDGKVITLSNIFVEKGVKMHHSAEVAEVIDLISDRRV